MSDKAQLEQLQEELTLVKNAMSPKEAAKSLQDFMDKSAAKDGLAGTGDSPNPWLQAPDSGPQCCTIS